MANWLNEVQHVIAVSKSNLLLSAQVVAFLWLVHIVNFLLGMRLNVLGILPRHPFGLIGIFVSPFLHGNFEHLLFNSVALFVLINLMLIYGWPILLVASIVIMVLTGFLVWCFGRKALHIGASGVMLGYWSFLLCNAYLQASVMAWILGGLCLYYLAGLGLSLLPTDVRTSWEAHVFGALSGVVTALLFFCLTSEQLLAAFSWIFKF